MTDAAPAPKTEAKPEAKPEHPLTKLFRERPPAAAGLLLVVLALPPLGVLMASLPEGWSTWCSASILLAACALVPALAALLRLGWANPAAQYLCWAEIGQVGLRIVSKGFSPVQAVPGIVAVGALMALTAAQPLPSAGTDRRPDSLGQWIKENIEAIIVAFIMALVIRCFCIEVFKIPSSSMEPTLLGDVSGEDTGSHPRSTCPFKVEHQWSNGGDRIMVTKYYYAFSSVERYDVVVFKFPLNQSKNFIKRVVGLPNEELMIHHGNIFVKRPGEKEFHIARRPQRTQDSLWISVDPEVDYLSSREDLLKKWRPVAPSGQGPRAEYAVDHRELTTLENGGTRGVRFERQDRIDDGHSQEVGELQLAFDFELTSPHGVLFAEIATEFGKFEVTFSTDAQSELKSHTPGKDDLALLKDVRLALDRRYHLAFSVYDGVASVRLNDEELGKLVFIENLKDDQITESHDRFVAFGSRDLTFKVRNLTLGRDVYYKGKTDRDARHIVDDQPVPIPPGCYVMMGDNVENSHDARSWSKRTFTLKDGRTVVAENQDVENSRTISPDEVMERYGLEKRPTTIVSADQYGNPWALYSESNVPDHFKAGRFVGVIAPGGDDGGLGFHFVEEKFIVGKALWIWWPKGRWFRLIR